jgi:hypothetical protein
MTPVTMLVAIFIGLIAIGAGVALCVIAVFYGWEKQA